jgi:hypothetical protein
MINADRSVIKANKPDRGQPPHLLPKCCCVHPSVVAEAHIPPEERRAGVVDENRTMVQHPMGDRELFQDDHASQVTWPGVCKLFPQLRGDAGRTVCRSCYYG